MSQQYIAKELTHFTRTYEKLCAILTERVILGGPDIEVSRQGGTEFIFNYREDISRDAMIKVNKVCFSDIPEGQMDIHKQKYGHFGISFDKDFIVGKGGIPVHYVPHDATINSRWANDDETRADFFDRMTKKLYEHFDDLIVKSRQDEERRKKYQRLHDFYMTQINPYYKFFDHKLSDTDINNYYFEREWLVVGSVKFELGNIRKVLLPKEDESRFRKDFPNYKGPVN